MAESTDEALGLEGEERLPWLEPIDDEAPVENSLVKLVGLVLAGLVVIGAIVGGLWWWQERGAAGRGELIAAPADAYKIPAEEEPGRFDGDGTIAVAAAEGVRPVGTVDPARVAEQPVPPAAARAAASAPRAPAQVATKSAAPAAGAESASPAPATAPAGTTGMIQLGAFASEATASRAWDRLKDRFEWLGPVNRSIVSAEVNGRTVWRLRAAAGSTSAARDLCNRLKVAGENCIVL